MTRFRVEGLVQGVGFRPFVWCLATELGLDGWVLNDGHGVAIEVRGPADALALFRERLGTRAPPLARIDALVEVPLPEGPLLEEGHDRESTNEAVAGAGFSIRESEGGSISTGVVADAATCEACLEEVFDRADRRYDYPFTNCTHCGPRFSIVEGIPYDRPKTTMASFRMCEDCQREYGDPSDRRFHAQPNACPVCGPEIWLEEGSSAPLRVEAIARAAELLERGKILAIKGIGGFHLACDATNEEAVATLRRRKHREAKPFGMMMRDLSTVARFCTVDAAASKHLRSAAAPLLLLPAEGDAALAASVALGQRELAVMLPYSPLHHRLLRAVSTPLVMTSANDTGAPQVVANDEARRSLAGVAEAFLMHDRPIAQRVDDSVARVQEGQLRLIRRARGYAPMPLLLHASFQDCPPVLAMGAELKVTACFLREGAATLTQHLGDLEHPQTAAEYERTLGLYTELFAFEPQAIVVDLHRDYHSTQVGERIATERSLPLVAVQHHHAHIASVLAEAGLPRDARPVLGIAMDGIGAGTAGQGWGCELLVADFEGYERVASLRPVALVGGERAMREPWRNLLAQAHQCFGWESALARWPDAPGLQALRPRQPELIATLIDQGVNAPLASSAGRLFDAVAAALGLQSEGVSFEGQAAMKLERAAWNARPEEGDGYLFGVYDDAGLLRLDPTPMWEALFDDCVRGRAVERIARRFHVGLAASTARLAIEQAQTAGIAQVVLSGGVFQNQLLRRELARRLETAGLGLLENAHVPTNDGGLSLGQAAIAAATMERSARSS